MCVVVGWVAAAKCVQLIVLAAVIIAGAFILDFWSQVLVGKATCEKVCACERGAQGWSGVDFFQSLMIMLCSNALLTPLLRSHLKCLFIMLTTKFCLAMY